MNTHLPPLSDEELAMVRMRLEEALAKVERQEKARDARRPQAAGMATTGL